MILIGMGANLTPPGYPDPRSGLEAALEQLCQDEIALKRKSPWYHSAPVPVSDQPWYVNGVAEIETRLSPDSLLAALHDLEARFGRERRQRNEARVIDLDLLQYNQTIIESPAPGKPCLPHPRMHERAFVLLPLRDLAPDWAHPVSGASLSDLIAALDPTQMASPLPAPEEPPATGSAPGLARP